MIVFMRWIGLFAALLIPGLLWAGEAGNPLKIELISETRSIAEGKTFHLGLHLTHPAGSHTYWKHPGIVGLATTVEWEMPPGFTAGEIQWPAPQVVKMASYKAQGYEGETLLMIPITLPEKLTGSTATLTAKVSWMCCGKTCEPAMKIPFTITLPVTESMEKNTAALALFEKFQLLVPKADPLWKITVQRRSKEIWLTLKPSPRTGVCSDEDFARIHFFTADGQVDSSRQQVIKMIEDGTISMGLPVSENGPKNQPALTGVVILPDGKRLEVDPKF